jgi:hypothetical protein
MSRWLMVAFVAGLDCARAATDPRVESISTLLTGMRSEKARDLGPRGASPALTEVKHQLRDWIESRMSTLDQGGDAADLRQKLNSELGAAGLLCGWVAKATPCPDEWQLGYLSEIDFRRTGGFLILITHTGIECGFDDSAYLYEWSAAKGWRRVWQTEQTAYTKEAYRPQNIESIQVSSTLVLTLGNQPWCSSNWRELYYRVFRLAPDAAAGAAKPLINGVKYGFASDAIEGSVGPDDALVQFSVASVDGAFIRRAIRHFQIDHQIIRRVDPLALSPRDFSEEWLTEEWGKETAEWSDPAGLGRLRAWHNKLHKDNLYGDFIDPTMHCPATPDLWQVGFDLSDPRTPFDQPPKGTYFLIRWRPPYRFSMVSVSDKPFPNCTEKDPAAEDQQRTLFPNR